MKKGRLKYFMGGAGMLAACSVAAKLLGALYRVPLTGVLGGEGMGLYQTVFPLYALLLTVSSGGLPSAISRLVAVRTAGGDEKGSAGVLRVSLAALSAVGIVLALLLMLLSRPVARIQGNVNAAPAYIAVAPSILLAGVIACFRGYYQGKQNMAPSAVSQLIEQAVKLVAGLSLARALAPRGVAYAAAGALVGVTLSELAAVLALVFYHLYRTKRPTSATPATRTKRPSASARLGSESARAASETAPLSASVLPVSEAAGDMVLPVPRGGDKALPKNGEKGKSATWGGKSSENSAILKELLRVSLPITFGSLLLPLGQVADSVLVVNILVGRGAGTAAATAAYGLVSGIVSTLVGLPAAVTAAFSCAMLPRIASAAAGKRSVAAAVGKGWALSLAFAAWSALSLFVYARPVVALLYAGGLTPGQIGLCASLLRVSAVSALYVAVVQGATAVLQGLGRVRVPAANLAVGAVAKVLVTVAMLYAFGIYGAAIGSTVCYAITALLDLRSVKRADPALVLSPLLPPSPPSPVSSSDVRAASPSETASRTSSGTSSAASLSTSSATSSGASTFPRSDRRPRSPRRLPRLSAIVISPIAYLAVALTTRALFSFLSPGLLLIASAVPASLAFLLPALPFFPAFSSSSRRTPASKH